MKHRLVVMLGCLLLLAAVGIPAGRWYYLRSKTRSWSNTFNLGVDLTRLQQGEWVEYDEDWTDGVTAHDGYRHSTSSNSRMACVRANPDEVWIEISPYAPEHVLLFRVERRTRRIVAGWEMFRSGTPVPIRIHDAEAWKPPPGNWQSDVSRASGDMQVVPLEVNRRKLTAQQLTFECNANGWNYRCDVVLCDEVPCPIPPGGDSHQSHPCGILGEVGAKIPWKNLPDLRGGVVSSEVSRGDPAGGPRMIWTMKLRAFGHDAKPRVIVDGETDEASPK